MASEGPKPAEKLSVPFGAKEQEILAKMKGKEGQDAEKSKEPSATNIINEQKLDGQSDKITAEIEKAKAVLAPQYADKLTAKLDSIITGAKGQLEKRLTTINEQSAKTLEDLHTKTLENLSKFFDKEKNPEAAALKLFAEKAGEIKGISEMKLDSYAKGSGYHEVINQKLAEKGIAREDVVAIQKALGITADGKVGPETINHLSNMLKLGLKVKFGEKTILTDGKEVDAEGNIVPPKAEKSEQPKESEGKPEPPKPEPPKPPKSKPEAVPEPRRESEPASRRPPNQPEPPKVAEPPAPQPPPESPAKPQEPPPEPPPEPPKAEPEPKSEPKPKPVKPPQEPPLPEEAPQALEVVPKEEGAKTPEVTDPQKAEEANKLKGDIGLLRKNLDAKKTEFTGEKLQADILAKLTTGKTPPEITAAIKQKITDAKFDQSIAAMIAKAESSLSIAGTNEDPAAIISLLGDTNETISSLTIENFLQTPEVKALTDRLIEPMNSVNNLMKIIPDSWTLEGDATGPMGEKVLQAKQAIIEATVGFINNEKAKFDIMPLEKNLKEAIEQDIPEDQRNALEEAARITEWFSKPDPDRVEKDVQCSFEREPEDGDFKHIEDPINKSQRMLYKYEDGKWNWVANFPKALFEEKNAKYEKNETAYKSLKEAATEAHKSLIEDKKISNLYRDFKISEEGDRISLMNGKHSEGDHEDIICQFNIDQATGKIMYKGKEIQITDVKTKMQEAGDIYIKSLEYHDLTDSEEEPESLRVKFKNEIDERQYELQDADYFESRSISKIGENIVVTYKTTESIPGTSDGRIRTVDLATFTISKGGSVSVNLNTKYTKTIDAKYVPGETPQIILTNKEPETAEVGPEKPDLVKFDSPEWKEYEKTVGATGSYGGLPVFSKDAMIMSDTIKGFTGTILFTNSSWCDACKRIKPFMKQLADERPEMNLKAQLETGSSQFYDATGKIHEISKVPLLVTFKNGRVIKQTQPTAALNTGATKKEDVYDKNKVMNGLRGLIS